MSKLFPVSKLHYLYAGGICFPPVFDETSSGLIPVESLAVLSPAGRSACEVPFSFAARFFAFLLGYLFTFSCAGSVCRFESIDVSWLPMSVLLNSEHILGAKIFQ